jgi:hypothetical protein
MSALAIFSLVSYPGGMYAIPPDAIVELIATYGPAPTLIAGRLGITIQSLRKLVVEDPDLLRIYQQQVDRVAVAIGIYGTNKARACDYLGVERSTFELWVADNPRLRRQIENARAAVGDMAEQKLAEAVAKGDWRAIELVLLRSQDGQSRGYGDKSTGDLESESARLGVDWRRLVGKLSDALAEEGADLEVPRLPAPDD